LAEAIATTWMCMMRRIVIWGAARLTFETL
jgi:hypothetical protein